MINDAVVLAEYTCVTVLDDAGEVVASSSGWYDAQGNPVRDPALRARLEENMARTTRDYENKQDVEYLENDDVTWSPARIISYQENDVYLIRLLNGVPLGVPADRLRPIESEE